MSRARLDRDVGAAQRVEHLGEPARAGRQRAERGLCHDCGSSGIEIAQHLAGLAIDDRQALEQVVDLILADLQPQLVAVHDAVTLEVADAVAVEHDPHQR